MINHVILTRIAINHVTLPMDRLNHVTLAPCAYVKSRDLCGVIWMGLWYT